MRAFLGVPCGEDFAAQLSTALDPLRDLPGLRWSASGQYHLTLAFLGDWPENRIPPLQEALAGLSWPEAFTLDGACWGAFPDLAAPRVLFVQWPDDAPLVNLARKVRRQVRLCWPDSPVDQKPFRGHLTVARSRRLDEATVRRLGAFALPALPGVRVGEFRLYRSELDPAGARHTVLSCYPLG